jgi:hypothetical protein
MLANGLFLSGKIEACSGEKLFDGDTQFEMPCKLLSAAGHPTAAQHYTV